MLMIRPNVTVLLLLILSACGSVPQRKAEQPSLPLPQAQPQPQSQVSPPAQAPPQLPVQPQAQPQNQSQSVPAGQGQPGSPITSLPLTQRGAYLLGDGPGTDIPANLDAIPNAVPREEPLHRFANRPYSALGTAYKPVTVAGKYKARGIASWYGKKFHGQRTSSGEVYDMYSMTAAHPTLPIPSYARVTRVANKESVVVRINDRGPFLHGRIIDLSYAAALKLGYINNGSAEVEVQSLPPGGSASTPPATDITMNEALLAPDQTGAATASTGQIYLQLGAFKSQQSAQSFLVKMRSEFEGSSMPVALYQNDELVRVHLGPYPSRQEARAAADNLQARLGFKPVLSQR
jgi:rare lipoprotein A